MDVLDHEEELALLRDYVERARHVRMADPRGGARLVQKHGGELGVLRELWVEPLDGHGSREADVPEKAADVHRRHATRCDFVMKGVSPHDANAGRIALQRHTSSLPAEPGAWLDPSGPS